MDTIILGLLMLKNLTIYELSSYIQTYFSPMSSNSRGSIQAAVRRLLEKDMITYHEFVENSVNKKAYEITNTGKTYFQSTIKTPMRYKEKNMELSKLFFMGFAPKEKRGDLIDLYIDGLKKEKEGLQKIRMQTQDRQKAAGGYLKYLEQSSRIRDFIDNTNAESALDGILDIAKFQYATLELCIEKIGFEICWFEKFKNQLEEIK